MQFDLFSEKIGNLIGSNQLEQAIKQLSRLLEKSELLDEVIVQSARYNDIMQQIRRGMIDYERADITKNQIRFALLDILRELEEKYHQDEEVKKEIDSIELKPNKKSKISQIHYGKGDNVAGDKTINH